MITVLQRVYCWDLIDMSYDPIQHTRQREVSRRTHILHPVSFLPCDVACAG